MTRPIGTEHEAIACPDPSGGAFASKRAEVAPELVGLHVLVADADLDDCLALAQGLEQMGLRCDWTTSVDETAFRVRLAAEEGDDFHAALISAPSGSDTLRVLAETHRVIGPKAPLVALCDKYDVSLEALHMAGASAVVDKPPRIDELRHALSAPYGETESDDDLPQPESFHGSRLLVVEGNVVNREAAVRILSAAGFMVETAESGRDAVSMVCTKPAGYYDLILMDIRVPAVDGFQAAQDIRDLTDERRAGVPIIAMTATAQEEDRNHAASCGVNDLVAKPINVPQLMRLLARYVA